jgi:hypothetical protein
MNIKCRYAQLVSGDSVVNSPKERRLPCPFCGLSNQRRGDAELLRQRLRQAIREAFAVVADRSGASFAQRYVEDIATRAAAMLSTLPDSQIDLSLGSIDDLT